MRKILSVTFTLILCLMLIAPAWGEEGGLDGYLWEQMLERDKFLFMSGFLQGHNIGFTNAQFSDIKGKTVIDLVLLGLQYRYREKDKTVPYYIKELDAFLQTYPLCKKQDLVITIGQLAWVWIEMPNMKQVTYKELGEGCSK